MANSRESTEKLLGGFAPERDSGPLSGPDKQRQALSQACTLRIISKDGRWTDHFPWSLYGGHGWSDDGDMETIIAVFGARMLRLRGYRFNGIDREMSECKRASIRMNTSREVQDMLREESNEPIFVEIEITPTLPEIWASVQEK